MILSAIRVGESRFPDLRIVRATAIVNNFFRISTHRRFESPSPAQNTAWKPRSIGNAVRQFIVRIFLDVYDGSVVSTGTGSTLIGLFVVELYPCAWTSMRETSVCGKE